MNRRTFLTLTLKAGVAATVATAGAPALSNGSARVAAFSKQNRYRVSGRAELVNTNNGYAVNLLDDFRFGDAPDPKIALGRNGYDKRTLMGLLKANKGASSYTVPTGIDAAEYNEVWIWCERFNVPLAVARL